MYLKKFFFKSTNSTNDEAIKKIKQGDEKGIIIAEKQKKGRGRYGNKWISIKGNLFISIFFNIKKNKSLTKITKKNCILLKKTFNKFINKEIQIKPPNDLLIDKKKFCGILQETINFKEKKFIIIGIGVNLYKSPNINNYPTTHLSNYNEKINKIAIFKKIKKCYENEYLCI
tara:strand:+ start:658 stop:1173 length:516 start_codon:yes stop_codon:yes gene_type:complete